MSSILTERGEQSMTLIELALIIGTYVFIAYAIAQHIGWTDGAAIALAFNRLIVAFKSRP